MPAEDTYDARPTKAGHCTVCLCTKIHHGGEGGGNVQLAHARVSGLPCGPGTCLARSPASALLIA